MNRTFKHYLLGCVSLMFSQAAWAAPAEQTALQ